MIFLFCFLFVCPELIEELAEATDLKFGMRVEDVVTRNKTKDCVGFQLVLLLPTD